jgi:hypothetical protein
LNFLFSNMVWRATTDPLAGRMRPAGRVFEDAGLGNTKILYFTTTFLS